MSAFQAPADVPEPAAGAFGACECGHRIYDHGRHNQDSNQVWDGCRIADCPCTSWRSSTGSQWPHFHSGPVPDEPTDLHVNTDAWVDGQVLLAHEREPDIGGPK